MEDRLIIGVSIPNEFSYGEDVPVLTVMRLSEDRKEVLKSFTGQVAIDVHKFLTENKPKPLII